MGHHFEPGTVDRIHQEGMAIAHEDTMSQAIHDVYCGIMAGHTTRTTRTASRRARMIAALQKAST